MPFPVLTAASAFVIATAVLYLVRQLIRPIVLPGIPYNAETSNLLLGDIPELRRLQLCTDEISHPILSLTTRRHKKPVVQFLRPGKPLVVVDDIRESLDILTRRGDEIDRADLAAQGFGTLLPRCTIGQYTTAGLRAQKRLWADAVGADFLRHVMAPRVHEAAMDLLDLWETRAELDPSSFETHPDLNRAALDAIYVAVLGVRADATRAEVDKLKGDGRSGSYRGSYIKEAIQYGGNTFVAGVSSPFPRLYFFLVRLTPSFRAFRATVKREMGALLRDASERFQRIETGKLEADGLDRCAMDLVLRRQVLAAQRAGVPAPDPTRDAALADELMLLLLAGTDSTANTLAWFVKLMEANPAVQRTLRARLQDALPDPFPPSAEAILSANIPYLDATVEETLRVAATAGCMSRKVLRDMDILGHNVPAGSTLLINIMASYAPLQVDDSLRSSTSRATREKRRGFGLPMAVERDCGRFEPANWLLVDDKTGAERFDAYAMPNLAFGAGFRGCFGRRMARQELILIMTLLVLRFEFLPVQDRFRSMEAVETIFRRPKVAHARLRTLRTL